MNHTTSFFEGESVILTAVEAETDAAAASGWSHDAEYQRLCGIYPPIPFSQVEMQKKFEEAEKQSESGRTLIFAIRRREDERFLGVVFLENIEITNGACQELHIGIGDSHDRGMGYGSQALQMVIKYAFQELNLHRIAVSISSQNPGAIRFFQKAGFSIETHRRKAIFSGGNRSDEIRLGFLRSEWDNRQPERPLLEDYLSPVRSQTILEEKQTQHPLWKGSQVHLCAPDAGDMAALQARWSRRPEYARFIDTEPARLWSVRKFKEDNEKFIAASGEQQTYLAIRTLVEDRVIGFIALFGRPVPHQDAWISIGIGDPDFWDKGMGTDAIQILLRYAFDELNLFRLTLTVLEYNQRAIHCYEKLGFSVEGRERECCLRDGKRWDLINMGILRTEWVNA